MYSALTLFTNYYLMSAVLAWLLAQFIKAFTGFFKEQDFTLRALFFGTGGMPSSHTAAVCALATSFAVRGGFGSPLFAITSVLAIVVMIDAMGVRRETGKQSRALNLIVEELFSSNGENFNLRFKELIGHSPLQVFFGMLTGIATAIALSFVPAFAALPVV